MAEKLNFYNLKTKKKFATDKYTITKKSGRTFAVAKQDGRECWRIVSAKKAKK